MQKVHHGVAAVKSQSVMEWLARNKIQLNICSSSNVMLGVVKSYSANPIKELFQVGIPVTINTDDLLLFNKTIGEEYLNLYKSGALSASELDKIRRNGLDYECFT